MRFLTLKILSTTCIYGCTRVCVRARACVYMYMCGVCMCTDVCSCEFMGWVVCHSGADPFGEIQTYYRRFGFVFVMDPIHK